MEDAEDFPWSSTPIHSTTATNQSSQGNNNIVSDGVISSVDTAVPLVMVALASSILVCAAALYLTDIRDRCLASQSSPHHRLEEDPPEPPVRRDPHSHSSWRSSSKPELGAFPTLPHIFTPEEQPDNIEDMTISPVSTITESMAVERRSRAEEFQRTDSDLYLMRSTDVTELGETHRVEGDVELASLVDGSRLGSSTPDYDRSRSGHNDNNNDNGDFEDVEQSDLATVHYHRSISKHFRINDSVQVSREDDEENDSGWTSVFAPSDDSSEASIGTILRSLHSRKSLSSSDREKSIGDSLSDGTHDDSCVCSTKEARDEDDGLLLRSSNTPLEPSRQCTSTEASELSRLESLCRSASNTIERTNGHAPSQLEALLERERSRLIVEKDHGESMEEATEIDDSMCQSRGHSAVVGKSSEPENNSTVSTEEKADNGQSSKVHHLSRKINGETDGEEFIPCHDLEGSKNLSSLSIALEMLSLNELHVDGFDAGLDDSGMNGSCLIEI